MKRRNRFQKGDLVKHKILVDSIGVISYVEDDAGTISLYVRWISWIAKPFENMSVSKEVSQVAQPVSATPASSDQPYVKVKGFDVYVKVLAQAAIDGDVAMCASVLNKLHGKKFITLVSSKHASKDGEQ